MGKQFVFGSVLSRILLVVAVIFLSASCSDIGESAGASRVEVFVSSQAARSAFPVLDGIDVSYEVTATNGTRTEISTEPTENGAYQLGIESGEWSIDIIGKRQDNGEAILYGSDTISVPATGYYSKTIPVVFFQSGTGSGSVSLTVDASAVSAYSMGKLVIDGIGERQELVPSGGVYSLLLDSVSSGDYPVTMKFFSVSGEFLFIIPERISVRQNMTTEKWFKNGGEPYISTTSFVLSDSVIKEIISTQFFVKGNGGSLSASASDSGSGNWKEPFESLDAAVKRAEILGAENYTVFIDGTVSGGGTISYGNAKICAYPGTSACGISGGITVTASGGDVSFSGISITGGSSGGISVPETSGAKKISLSSVSVKDNEGFGINISNGAELCMSGAVTVSGNWYSDGNKRSEKNVVLPADGKIKIAGELSSSSEKIGITLDESDWPSARISYFFTDGFSANAGTSAKPWSVFKSDNGKFTVVWNGDSSEGAFTKNGVGINAQSDKIEISLTYALRNELSPSEINEGDTVSAKAEIYGDEVESGVTWSMKILFHGSEVKSVSENSISFDSLKYDSSTAFDFADGNVFQLLVIATYNEKDFSVTREFKVTPQP